MGAIKAFLPPLGRLLMSSIFIYEGVVLLRHPAGFTKYFASVHVPAPSGSLDRHRHPACRRLGHPRWI